MAEREKKREEKMKEQKKQQVEVPTVIEDKPTTEETKDEGKQIVFNLNLHHVMKNKVVNKQKESKEGKESNVFKGLGESSN
jgi:hypothetical protein